MHLQTNLFYIKVPINDIKRYIGNEWDVLSEQIILSENSIQIKNCTEMVYFAL